MNYKKKPRAIQIKKQLFLYFFLVQFLRCFVLFFLFHLHLFHISFNISQSTTFRPPSHYRTSFITISSTNIPSLSSWTDSQFVSSALSRVVETISSARESVSDSQGLGLSLVIGATAVSSIVMFRKFLGLKRSDGPIKYVNVQVGRATTYKLEFDENDALTVGLVRKKAIELLKNNGKQLESVSLIFSGKKLMDDNALLSACGVSNGNKILVTIRRPGTEAAPETKTPATPPPPPLSPRERIQKVLDSVTNDLEGAIKAFCQSPPKNSAVREDEHRRLSETVLQKMFSLDNVDVADDQDARAFRKQVINRFHGLHSDLDDANKKAETQNIKTTNNDSRSISSQTSKSSKSSKSSRKKRN